MKPGPLGPGDLDDALALSTAEGWNQTAADWGRLLRLDPDGCFAARDGSRLVGTVTTVTYGRDLAWIGMMVVHPDFRGRGLGAALMEHALGHAHALGVACVKLDATPAGRPLYESLGFEAETEMERWQGVARSDARPGPAPRPLDALRALLALDRSAFGVDRSAVLGRLATEGAAEPLVEPAGGVPAGCALARRGRAAAYLGPLIATNADTARRLLDGMLARLDGQEVCLDLHRGGRLEPDALAARGLSKRRVLVRMARGARSAAGTSPAICASAGPELG